LFIRKFSDFHKVSHHQSMWHIVISRPMLYVRHSGTPTHEGKATILQSRTSPSSYLLHCARMVSLQATANTPPSITRNTNFQQPPGQSARKRSNPVKEEAEAHWARIIPCRGKYPRSTRLGNLVLRFSTASSILLAHWIKRPTWLLRMLAPLVRLRLRLQILPTCQLPVWCRRLRHPLLRTPLPALLQIPHLRLLHHLPLLIPSSQLRLKFPQMNNHRQIHNCQLMLKFPQVNNHRQIHNCQLMLKFPQIHNHRQIHNRQLMPKYLQIHNQQLSLYS